MSVVARWEWRIFQADLEDGFVGLEPDRVEESDEGYLLAPHSDASGKIRGGRLDVKQLLDVDEDGLEGWRPVLKTGFPVSTADLQLACSALAVAPPPLERAAYPRE